MNINEETKNKIIELFCNTHKKIPIIVKEVAPNGEITIEDVYNVLNEYNDNNPDGIKRRDKVFLLEVVSDEEIFELRERKLTDGEIVDYFAKDNRIVTKSFINSRCKVIYRRKGRKDPVEREQVIITKEMDEEIYNLREQRYGYDEIAKYFLEKGMIIGIERIRHRCKEIYDDKGEKNPDLRKNSAISDDEVFKLREQRLSYERMEKYFREKGIAISKSAIDKRCKEIYRSLGKEEPDLLRKAISNEEIFYLREHGFTYNEISEYFNKEGKAISSDAIRNRCKKIYRELRLEEPRANSKKYEKKYNGVNRERIDLTSVDKEKLKQGIEKLKKSRWATDEQVKILAELYGVDFEEEKEKEL